jgi:hypothetical protein
MARQRRGQKRSQRRADEQEQENAAVLAQDAARGNAGKLD